MENKIIQSHSVEEVNTALAEENLFGWRAVNIAYSKINNTSFPYYVVLLERDDPQDKV